MPPVAERSNEPRDSDRSLAELRHLGQRVTPARVAVLSVLHRATEHLDAAEIVDRAAEEAPGVHRATVYRALSTLCDLGLVTHTHVTQTRASGAGTVYHLRTAGGPAHAHLQCTVCGTLIDLPGSTLLPLVRTIARTYDFALEPQHAALLGVCSDCRTDNA